MEHRLSALLQLHLQYGLNTWLQWLGQRQLQDEARNISVLGFGATYIRDLTVIRVITPGSPTSVEIFVFWEKNRCVWFLLFHCLICFLYYFFRLKSFWSLSVVPMWRLYFSSWPLRCCFYFKLEPSMCGYDVKEYMYILNLVIVNTVKPVYNDHLVGYFSAFWSSSRWSRAT